MIGTVWLVAYLLIARRFDFTIGPNGTLEIRMQPDRHRTQRGNDHTRRSEAPPSLTRSGAILNTRTGSYPANYFQQVTASEFAGMAVSNGDYIEIEVTAGSAFVYGAWIDNITQDPSVQFAQ